MKTWALVGGLVTLGLLILIILFGAVKTPNENFGWKIYQGKGDALALVAHSPEAEFNATIQLDFARGPIQAAFAPLREAQVNLSWSFTANATAVTIRHPGGSDSCVLVGRECALSLHVPDGGELAWVLGLKQGNVTFVAERQR